jgi:hypothetical protein
MRLNWMRYHLPSSGQNNSACRPASAGVTSAAVSSRPVGSGCSRAGQGREDEAAERPQDTSISKLQQASNTPPA